MVHTSTNQKKAKKGGSTLVQYLFVIGCDRHISRSDSKEGVRCFTRSSRARHWRVPMKDCRLSERNQAEIERSAAEARKVVLKPLEQAQIDRYLNPPADTPYPLEYAFHLLGDVRGKTVLDLGCGKGENIIPLLERGARVIGIDISPDLVAIAQERLSDANLEASLTVGSAYETGLPDESVDVIFCIALIHHLDIKLVRDEMWRVLRKGGVIILKEPVRFSKGYAGVRSLLPAREDISEFEHPL